MCHTCVGRRGFSPSRWRCAVRAGHTGCAERAARARRMGAGATWKTRSRWLQPQQGGSRRHAGGSAVRRRGGGVVWHEKRRRTSGRARNGAGPQGAGRNRSRGPKETLIRAGHRERGNGETARNARAARRGRPPPRLMRVTRAARRGVCGRRSAEGSARRAAVAMSGAQRNWRSSRQCRSVAHAAAACAALRSSLELRFTPGENRACECTVQELMRGAALRCRWAHSPTERRMHRSGGERSRREMAHQSRTATQPALAVRGHACVL